MAITETIQKEEHSIVSLSHMGTYRERGELRPVRTKDTIFHTGILKIQI